MMFILKLTVIFEVLKTDTLSLGFDVFNAEGGLLISLEMHRRPNPHGSDWQKDVFSAKNARIQAVYRYECDKHFYGEKCEVKCKNSLNLPKVLCNSHGKLDCKKGWTGAKCQIKIDPTHCECKNDGICVCENSNIKEIGQQERSQENARMPSHSRRSDGAAPFESSQSIDRTPVLESPDETTKLPLIVIFFLFSIVVVQMIFIFRKCYGQKKPKNLSENGKIQEVFTVEKDVELGEKKKKESLKSSERCRSPEARYSSAPTKSKLSKSTEDFMVMQFDEGDESIYEQIVVSSELPTCKIETTI
ncbi:hypothetical protein WR25_25829 [Diploscapter pachys]|uniref:Delta-like protein n=1 Tax=Diploscapter pachys TaxID=2018661 RepID=A0A2A2JLN6_9BILA|nr:hypothetical protein WR25_25829 [Diploscapter pachys]